MKEKIFIGIIIAAGCILCVFMIEDRLRLEPGKPPVKDQISKMNEEITFLKNEVYKLRFEISQQEDEPFKQWVSNRLDKLETDQANKRSELKTLLEAEIVTLGKVLNSK